MAKKQSEIYKRQNEPEMQSLLITQHYTYSSAKCWVAVLFCVLVLLPLGINIALFFTLPDIVVGLLAFFSLLLLGIGEIIREHIQNEKKAASMLQQKFDLYVFDINMKYGIDENIVAEKLEKYSRKDWSRKQNWYQNYEDMNQNKAIFYCQKENIDWTGNLAKRYCMFLSSLIGLMFISFVVNLIIQNNSIIKILSILISSLPLISYGFSSYKKIKRDNDDLIEIDKIAKEINADIDTFGDLELGNKVNVLQTMLYKFRQSKYLIPDWFEKRFYKRLQAVEARKAGQRLAKNKKSKIKK